MALRRINYELKKFRSDPPQHCTVEPFFKNDPFKWTAIIMPPPNCPYSNGIFSLNVIFPQDYPFKPMKIRFNTKIYHPNINDNGMICCECCDVGDLLKDNWSPALNISYMLKQVVGLVSNMDNCVPADVNCGHNREGSKLFRENKKKFNKIAAAWTLKYASINQFNK